MTTTTTTTIAHRIAEQFGNDGQQWQDAEGRDIGDVCAEQGHESYARAERIGDTAGYRYEQVSPSDAYDVIRYVFEDGSALVIATDSGGWDIEGSVPFSWAGAE